MDSGLVVPLLTCSSLCESFKRRLESSISHGMLFLLTSQRHLFDTDDHTTLWKILGIHGCPDNLVSIAQFHNEMKSQLVVNQ